MFLTKHEHTWRKGAFFMNKTEKEQQRQLWFARLCELEESEMTQEEWCKSRGIPYSTFRYWFRKLKKEAEDGNRQTNWLKVDMPLGNKIAKIHLPEELETVAGSINIRFGEFTVEIQNGCDSQRISEVLRILRAL